MNDEATTTELTHSPDIGEIGAALAKAQAAIKQPAKTREAKIASAKGNYGYMYADLPDVLEACIPHLSANGISVVQAPSTGRDFVAVTSLLIHSSGQWLKCKLTMGIADTRPQTVGSAITYARRYSLGPLVGVAPEHDDDGASASEPRQGGPRLADELKSTPAQGVAPRVAKALAVFREDFGLDTPAILARLKLKSIGEITTKVLDGDLATLHKALAAQKASEGSQEARA